MNKSNIKQSSPGFNSANHRCNSNGKASARKRDTLRQTQGAQTGSNSATAIRLATGVRAKGLRRRSYKRNFTLGIDVARKKTYNISIIFLSGCRHTRYSKWGKRIKDFLFFIILLACIILKCSNYIVSRPCLLM